MDTLRTDEHARAAARLRADPDREIERALARIAERMRHPLGALDERGRGALREWRRMLEAGDLEALELAMTDTSEHSIAMRRYSPWGRWWS